MYQCYFKDIFKCTSDKNLQITGPNHIIKIIESSKLRQDNLHVDTETKLHNSDTNTTIKCHRNCVSSYTSMHHINRYLKRVCSADSSEPIPIKRTRRSLEATFDFRTNCLFCGEICLITPDKKHPRRWRKALLCRTVARPGKQSFKEANLEVCAVRKDEIAGQIEHRLSGAVSDLHAADARYHDDCRKSFMGLNNIKVIQNREGQRPKIDVAFEKTFYSMKDDRSHVWTSVEAHELYTANGGSSLSRSDLCNRLVEESNHDMLVFSSPGLANIILFKETATSLLRVVEYEEDDKCIEQCAKQIVKECKDLPLYKDNYASYINKELARDQASQTLLSLLSAISDKLERSLPALLISNMVTAAITNKPTSLKIALGIQMREKSKIESLYDFGVTCSYSEILRFKTSAAITAAKEVNANVRPIVDSKDGLIQAVADNFDANISFQNGLVSTHALALLITQQKKPVNDTSQDEHTIKRIGKLDMKKEISSDISIQHYRGPKKPCMPVKNEFCRVKPLKVLAEQVVLLERARTIDLEFMKSITNVAQTPEFHGCNTKYSRQQGQCPKPATTAMYFPLIDMVPSDPDTMMTAMYEAQSMSLSCGQEFTVFTADQQFIE